jgi:pyruvate/2-oxoglutarate/acetoin dehydrogenase E1 component/TPP-dependent pyruvate/acetoin dehydrogenase alpha subunit
MWLRQNLLSLRLNHVKVEHFMTNTTTAASPTSKLSFEDFKQEVLNDFKMAVSSREASLIGRKEVLTGKAKFGIFGDGKELAQIAAAKCMQNGDIRSGYYRDQTLMFATGMSDIEKFFSQLYANPNVDEEPSTAGRMMNGHYGTRWLDENGDWKNLMEAPQSSSDISPTAGQMVRALGMAYASKIYRNVPELHKGFERFTNKGNEVIFCTIGDASTSEGLFWETINAAGVLKVPLAVFVWDDGYGISVPRKYQTTKNSISQALAGMQWDEESGGVHIETVKAWDYPSLINTFKKGIARTRETHIPTVFHVQEVTQPQGHSTSGSHERYKSPERLQFEKEMDCIVKMKEFILENQIANEETIAEIEESAKQLARDGKQAAWQKFIDPIKELVQKAASLCNQLVMQGSHNATEIAQLVQKLTAIKEPIRKDVMQTLYKVIALCSTENNEALRSIKNFYNQLVVDNQTKFNSKLFSESKYNVHNIQEVASIFNENSGYLNGYEILNKYFDNLFETNPAVVAFGEDLGKIGDVNQGFAGLQDKYGEMRITDTGIREATIVGQGLGLALRGLRPIAEIQYLDYLLYGLQPLSDDVATLQYRTFGGQKCPLIIRTRGHRLEGIWHSGSPMGMIINSIRGMHLCVPRNMTQAAGMYNTLLKSDEPAIVVECLNGYRLKEQVPENLFDYTVPLGIPETIQQGDDVTIVSYGSTLRIIQDAIDQYLAPQGISCEVIDVRTLLPFDINHMIVESLKKTSRIIFIDEDVPGGASAYMYQQVMEQQQAFRYLDAAPKTLSAKAHRPAYATDGDYFSKPNAEEIADAIIALVNE